MDSPTRVLSIDIPSLRKGDVIPYEKVEHFYIEHILGREKYELHLAQHLAGERIHHPLGRASAAVAEYIMDERRELGSRVVCRTRQKGVEVLTDAAAVVYRSNRANSALGLHRKQTRSLNNDIDERNLSTDERRQLESAKNYHTMIELSIASGKRTLKSMNMGELKFNRG